MSLLTSLFSVITNVDYFLRCTPIVHSLSQFLMLFLRSFYLRVYLLLFDYWCQLYLCDVLQLFSLFRHLLMLFLRSFILDSTFLCLGSVLEVFLLLMSDIFLRRAAIFHSLGIEFLSQFFNALRSFYLGKYLSFL